MSKWILARTLTLVGILGAPFSSASAKLPDGTPFASEQEARAYLRKNPEGPMAAAAFAALSQLRTEVENSGMSRDQIVETYTQSQFAQVNPGSIVRLPSETTAQDMY